ncbi:MAG: NAD(P)H-hydrate dehydratase [Treponema sp.]|nr:NAD(P)H-hydrate dehydratase [Treponema sp.]
MKTLVSCAQAARLDRDVQEGAGLPPLLLMEDASLRLWDALRSLEAGIDRGTRLTALCGSGNNAGDALAVLRHARFAGFENLAAILASSKPGELALAQLGYLKALGIAVFSWETDPEACRSLIERSAILLDGIAGTGLHGPVRENLASLMRVAGDSGRPVVAVDIPSGVSDECGPDSLILSARWTLAIEPRKSALYFPAVRPFCGAILPVGGIFPEDDYPAPAVELLEKEDLRRLVPPPPASAHKGTRGRVAVFAGSIGATGAPALASQAALAAGAGLVAVFASPDILPILSAKLDAVMVKPEPERVEAEDWRRWDAILLGPGWGRSAKNADTLRRILSAGRPAVLDADAIELYGSLVAEGFVAPGPLVLTPHAAEFARLAGVSVDEALANPLRVLPEAAEKYRAVIALKSHCTWIASPAGRLAVWEGMESALATAGSGDVLAGATAALLAAAGRRSSGDTSVASDPAFDATCAAVIAHGLAGRQARSAHGWFQAPALIEEIGRTLGPATP